MLKEKMYIEKSFRKEYYLKLNNVKKKIHIHIRNANHMKILFQEEKNYIMQLCEVCKVIYLLC